MKIINQIFNFLVCFLIFTAAANLELNAQLGGLGKKLGLPGKSSKTDDNSEPGVEIDITALDQAITDLVSSSWDLSKINLSIQSTFLDLQGARKEAVKLRSALKELEKGSPDRKELGKIIKQSGGAQKVIDKGWDEKQRLTEEQWEQVFKLGSQFAAGYANVSSKIAAVTIQTQARLDAAKKAGGLSALNEVKNITSDLTFLKDYGQQVAIFVGNNGRLLALAKRQGKKAPKEMQNIKDYNQ